jgi:hypothetical protein
MKSNLSMTQCTWNGLLQATLSAMLLSWMRHPFVYLHFVLNSLAAQLTYGASSMDATVTVLGT